MNAELCTSVLPLFRSQMTIINHVWAVILDIAGSSVNASCSTQHAQCRRRRAQTAHSNAPGRSRSGIGVSSLARALGAVPVGPYPWHYRNDVICEWFYFSCCGRALVGYLSSAVMTSLRATCHPPRRAWQQACCARWCCRRPWRARHPAAGCWSVGDGAARRWRAGGRR